MTKNNYYDEEEMYSTLQTPQAEKETATTQKLIKEERETLLNYCEADGYWDIDTSIAVHMRKFDKLGYECTNIQYYPDGTIQAKTYKVPKHAVSFRKPEKIKREMTEEQKIKAQERIKLMQEARKNSNIKN